jgi:hypothetical protein
MSLTKEKNRLGFVRYQNLLLTSLNMAVCWNVAPCKLIDIYCLRAPC